MSIKSNNKKEDKIYLIAIMGFLSACFILAIIVAINKAGGLGL